MKRSSLFAVALAGLVAPVAFAMSPAELQQKIAAGAKVIVVDVRPTSLFQKGHIPGAINVPAALVPSKQLPPLGNVVVCGDGFESTDGVIAELNKKNGIQAEALDGGFPAWETALGASTRAAGISREELPTITYQQLKEISPADMVLVDLRAASTAPSGPALQSLPLTDLQKEFPGATVTKSPFDLQSRQGAGARPPVLVLIDNGDGEAAQKYARTLKANGMGRVRILAGGEQILARGGQPGLQRMEVPASRTNINLR